MRQTILSTVIAVRPASAAKLRQIIVDFRAAEEGANLKYSGLRESVPSLHFMSMTVHADDQYDPVLVIECNFDGGAGPFWGQLEGYIGSTLREMMRCCQRPSASHAALFDSVIAPASRTPVAPLLEAFAIEPAVFHRGNRGLDRNRVDREAALFEACGKQLDDRPAWRADTAQTVHANLRAAMLPVFPWLDRAAARRISTGENVCDIADLVWFLAVVVIVLAAPGIVGGLLLPEWCVPVAAVLAILIALPIVRRLAGNAETSSKMTTFVLGGAAAAAVLTLIYAFEGGVAQAADVAAGVLCFTVATVAVVSGAIYIPRRLFGMCDPDSFANWLLFAFAAILGAIAGLAGLAAISPWFGNWVAGYAGWLVGFGDAIADVDWLALLAPAVWSIVAGATAVLAWIRLLEAGDPPQTAPNVTDADIRAMNVAEDQITQNHMISLVHIKPGMLRAVLLRAGLWGLGYIARLMFRDGFLASMRTIHFAHWAIVSNGGRLMFHSNFDGTWESYLDDFIEKAHVGLTLAWSNGVGFPPSRFLILDGATHGRAFKTWARHSMTPSQFWFSAYRGLTVNQIERQARVAQGLRAKTLSPDQADTWARSL